MGLLCLLSGAGNHSNVGGGVVRFRVTIESVADLVALKVFVEHVCIFTHVVYLDCKVCEIVSWIANSAV